jgi:hypothetical protein
MKSDLVQQQMRRLDAVKALKPRRWSSIGPT